MVLTFHHTLNGNLTSCTSKPQTGPIPSPVKQPEGKADRHVLVKKQEHSILQTCWCW